VSDHSSRAEEPGAAVELLPDEAGGAAVLPAEGAGDAVAPDQALADEVAPDRGQADEVAPDRSGADEVAPDRCGADEVAPDRSGADEVAPVVSPADDARSTEQPAGAPLAADDAAPDRTRADDAPLGEAPADRVLAVDASKSAGGPDAPVVLAARRRRRRRVLVAVVVVLVVLVGAAAWLAARVYQAGRALQAAQDGVTALAQDARDGDLVSLKAALPPLVQHLDTARRAVDDPVWRAATVLPWAGRQLGAVRTVTVALDDLVRTAGPALDAVDGALSAQDAPRTDGRLVLGPLVDALPPIVAAADQVDASSRAIAAIDASGLTPRLAAPVVQLQHQLAQVSGTVSSGAQLAKLLPALLGAQGPRSYLLVALNSAELRTQGGIVGAVALLKADNGTIDLGEQLTTSSFPGLATPILPLTPQEDAIQTNRLGRWIQDATMTPDFPRTAQLIAARWDAETGQKVDGVIVTDAVAAAELLKATGPVTTRSGTTLDASSLVSTLLRDVYVDLPYTNTPHGWDNAAADALYLDASAAIFHAVGNGQGDRLAVVDALAKAAQQGRVRVWSSHADEQSGLAASSLGAAFLSGDHPHDAGVFLDDGTAGKLDYYLTTKVSVEDLRCTGPDPTATVRLDLTYAPPADVAKLPHYVTGFPVSALPTGWLATNITVYSPVGAKLGALGLDDGFVSGTMATDAGRAVQVVTSWLPPGGHATYRATVPLHDGSLTVWSTPTLTSDGMQTASCGG